MKNLMSFALLVAVVASVSSFVRADGPPTPPPPPVPQMAKDAQDGTDTSGAGVAALSHPDIYPDHGNNTVIGELTVIIVDNSKEADTYVTLDGSDPVKTNPSAFRYTVPLHFSQQGKVWVKARSIPGPFIQDGHHVMSKVAEKIYEILPSKYPPPRATPSGGFFRGGVLVEATNPGAPGTKIKYLWKDYTTHSTNDIADHDKWVDYSEAITMNKVGKHFLFLQSVNSNDESDKSPFARYTFTITAPLVYDVSTECPKERCSGGKPTANEIFTVSVQNARAESWMFLSYSARCEYATKVTGTPRSPVDRHMPSNKFRIFEEAESIYVCVDEGSGAYPVKPRGAAADAKVTFSVQRGVRTLSAGEQQQQVEEANRKDQIAGVGPRVVKSSDSGISFGFFFMIFATVGAVLYLVRAAKNTGGRPKDTMNELHRQVVSDVKKLASATQQ